MNYACSKCGISFAEEIQNCPSCGAPISTKIKITTSSALTIGQRLAGGILLINGLCLLTEAALMPADIRGSDYKSVIFSILFGILLLSGYSKVLLWSKVGVVIGAIAFTAIHIVHKDMALAVFQMAFSAGLVLLLFGQAGRVRIGVSLVIFLLYFTVEAAGLQQTLNGRNFLTPIITHVSYDLTPLKGDTINGLNVTYTLKTKAGRWYQRNREDILRDNPDIDIWIVNTDYDAHLFTIVESLGPEERPDILSVVETAVANEQAHTDQFRLVERHPLVFHPGAAEFLETTGSTGGDQYIFNSGIFVAQNLVFRVVCYAFSDAFEHVRQQCKEMIESFHYLPMEKGISSEKASGVAPRLPRGLTTAMRGGRPTQPGSKNHCRPSGICYNGP